MKDSPIICLLGPTASGKTGLAVQLALSIDGEIISTDSRQVYRDMTIGTGKDLDEYIVDDRSVPYHLIDILDPGERYTVYDFKKDCTTALDNIQSRNRRPILCGGTGMYIDSIVFDYHLPEVPRNEELRKKLEYQSMDELVKELAALKTLHNTSDITDRERLIRAIEIAMVEKEITSENKSFKYESIVFGLRGERALIKERIEERLKSRLENGMIEEVEALLKKGLTYSDLNYYGLEYKFLGMHLAGDINYNDMYQKLRAAIFKFSKKQMTWFRRMEKRGIVIHWLNIEDGMEHNLKSILKNLEK